MMKKLVFFMLVLALGLSGCKGKEKATSKATTTTEAQEMPAEQLEGGRDTQAKKSQTENKQEAASAQEKQVEGMASDGSQQQPVEPPNEPTLLLLEKVAKEEMAALPRDFFTIREATIRGTNLVLSVEYSGGCGGANFGAAWNGMIMKSMPPKVSVMLTFDDQDQCEALIRKDIYVELSPLHEIESDKVVLSLSGYDESLLYKIKK